MPSPTMPNLQTFLKSLKNEDNIERSIELLVALLKRRQIAHSRPCAIATTRLMLQVVAERRWQSSGILEKRIREVGQRLVAAQPREMVVGNIVRRVLGLVHEVTEDDAPATDATSQPSQVANSISGYSTPLSQQVQTGGSPTSSDSSPRRPQLGASMNSYAGQTPHNSLFDLFTTMGNSPMASGTATPTPQHKNFQEEPKEKLDIKAEVIDGIKDLLEELDIVDSQIAENALDHIHSNEVILTHTSSQTVQRFLTAAARKRKFTVIHAEAYPNNHSETHEAITNGSAKAGEDEDDNERWKPLTSMGIKVIVVPDSAVFALMSRVNKVLMAPHSVLADGSLVAAAGAATIAQAAKAHKVPVVVLSGVYKLSPVYPLNTDDFIEYGDPGKVVPYNDGDFMDKVDVVNPVFDFVDADLVDLYITNLGAHAPTYLYRIVADHYRAEDIDLSVTA